MPHELALTFSSNLGPFPGFSYDATTVKVNDYVQGIPSNKSLCVFIGAMAHGEDSFADEYVDEKVSISDYPLSASVACGKVCCAMEDLLGIVYLLDFVSARGSGPVPRMILFPLTLFHRCDRLRWPPPRGCMPGESPTHLERS